MVMMTLQPPIDVRAEEAIFAEISEGPRQRERGLGAWPASRGTSPAKEAASKRA